MEDSIFYYDNIGGDKVSIIYKIETKRGTKGI